MKLIDKVTNTIASPPCETQTKNLRGLLSLSPPKKKNKHHFGEAFEFGPWPSEILYALGNFNLISSSPTLKLKHIRTWNVSFEILGGLGCFKGYHRVTIKPQSTLELLEATWRTPPPCNHRWNRVISTKAAHESLHMCLHCFQGANTATLPRSVGCSHFFSQNLDKVQVWSTPKPLGKAKVHGNGVQVGKDPPTNAPWYKSFRRMYQLRVKKFREIQCDGIVWAMVW